jgi:hypothetical protein
MQVHSDLGLIHTADGIIQFYESNYPSQFHSVLFLGIGMAGYLGWSAARYFCLPAYQDLFLKGFYPVFTAGTIVLSIFFEAHTWSGGLLEFWPIAFAMGMLSHILSLGRNNNVPPRSTGLPEDPRLPPAPHDFKRFEKRILAEAHLAMSPEALQEV